MIKIRREDAPDKNPVFKNPVFTATAARHPKFAITHVAFVPDEN